ncbi:MAG: DNA/RNA nuclease SfsA [Clostridia bacterium]|nr:DNA/RNA nuclease SfsA [Clostridia bacterium]
MNYQNVTEGIFLSRPNRFIAEVEIDGREETVHVKNTGRCRELLVPGCTVYLEKAKNPDRKTPYDLIGVEKITENGTILINMDSQIPNSAAAEFLPISGLFPEGTLFRREVTYGKSRFDLYAENEGMKAFIEVKGVTLEREGLALFPDAPTERGVKHINELIDAKEKGFGAYIIFIIQMTGVHTFSPNREMQPDFADALIKAREAGVQILAYDCIITPDSIRVNKPVTVKL